MGATVVGATVVVGVTVVVGAGVVVVVVVVVVNKAVAFYIVMLDANEKFSSFIIT